MRNIKKYYAPEAQVTEFECADIITESGNLGDIIDNGNPASGSSKTYVNIGGKSWSDIYKAN